MTETHISHHRALALLREAFPCAVGAQRLPLSRALGRYLAFGVAARQSVPPFDNAAVDGYAASRASVQRAAAEGRPLPVRGRIAAGDSPSPLAADAVCRIFTGAPIPPGADVVLMDEDVAARQGEAGDGGAAISISAAAAAKLRPGANIRRCGEDVARGDALFAAGHRLRPQDLAAAASLGMTSLPCRRRLRVAIFSTGHELREPSPHHPTAPSPAAAIHDSNRTLLRALLAHLPVYLHDGGILPDERCAIAEALSAAARDNDLLITSGGAGHGDADHILTALADRGKILFRRVAIKPGRPLSAAMLPAEDSAHITHTCACLALPGNPVAVMVCFLVYARPMLARLGGGEEHQPRFLLPAGFSMGKKAGRREFQRGILQPGMDAENCENAVLSVGRFSEQGSGILRSLRCADGLIELPERVTRISEGDLVSFLPFSALDA